MKQVYLIAFILVIIGAINWGLLGLMQIDLVGRLFGGYTVVSRIVYILVGVSGLIMIPKIKDYLK